MSGKRDKWKARALDSERFRDNAYCDRDWPNLNSIAVSISLTDAALLTPEALGVLYRLVHFVAARQAYSQFSEPVDDTSFSLDDAPKIAGATREEFGRSWPQIAQYFRVSKSRATLLRPEWIRFVPRVRRPQISAAVRADILERDGQVCAYCACTDGPFDIDHRIPVSRGGTSDPENLCVACASCNRSKGGRTPDEWGGRAEVEQ